MNNTVRWAQRLSFSFFYLAETAGSWRRVSSLKNCTSVKVLTLHSTTDTSVHLVWNTISLLYISAWYLQCAQVWPVSSDQICPAEIHPAQTRNTTTVTSLQWIQKVHNKIRLIEDITFCTCLHQHVWKFPDIAASPALLVSRLHMSFIIILSSSSLLWQIAQPKCCVCLGSILFDHPVIYSFLSLVKLAVSVFPGRKSPAGCSASSLSQPCSSSVTASLLDLIPSFCKQTC